MEIRQLRYFIEIIKSQNYSIAAKNLFVTQPTLSWNMNKLQEEVGVKLMYQVGNKVKPTTAGSMLYTKGGLILEDLDDLTRALEKENILEKKELTIGSNAVISPFFMPLIEQFMEVYPNFTITMEENGSVKTQKKVANEELEIGIVSFPIVYPDLEIEKNVAHTFNYDAIVVMKDDHPLANSDKLSLKELKNETFSSMSKDYVLFQVLQDKARDNGFTPEINFMSNNHHVLLKNLMKENTVAILPVQLKDSFSHLPLSWVTLDERIKPFDIVVIHKKNKPLSPAAALCLEFITSNKISSH